MKMLEKSEKRPHLTLVVSHSARRNEEEVGNAKLNSDEFEQLALFPDEQSPSVVYVRPSAANLGQILEGIKGRYIHAVLDIRETPYLSFPGVSRLQFLDLMAESEVVYLNVHRLMRSRGAGTVNEFLSYLANISSSDDKLLVELKELVSHGPVFVFSDKKPSDDQLVPVFDAALKRTNLQYEISYFAG